MASIFTYQEEPPRVHSPWSTPGSATPQQSGHPSQIQVTSNGGQATSITRLEPERQDGPTEYKLHLLLRSRRYQSANTSQVESPARSPAELPAARIIHSSTNSSRQARLQQLTTQLLWRLQQSSPFHSSSNADLVLPVLPEATPRLGIPDRPAKLLPGLEESQGALYEIGVADDGTLVGLVEEELEESLNNLRAMAASLGCVVEMLRRVLIAKYDRKLEQLDAPGAGPIKIWVAEVLVRPETKSPKILPLEEIGATSALPELHNDGFEIQRVTMTRTEQVRVAVTGATTAGKSSLVGTLTTSTLDNGRGKSRLSLLKHRHEIASGITSSVAQELLGYRRNVITSQAVVNYATGDVSSWPDIHNLASRLIFLSDSPGLPRYAKSTFRTLISWDPDWTLICIAANEDEFASSANTLLGQGASFDIAQRGAGLPESVDLSLAHLDMCLKLELPLVVVITKMDIATKPGLKNILSKVLSALKLAGRTPALLGSPSNTISNQDDNVDVASELAHLTDKEQTEITSLINRMKGESSKTFVPIVLSSAVTGAGIGKAHALLRELPSIKCRVQRPSSIRNPISESLFHVDEIFAIPPSKVYYENRGDHSADHGIVLCGHVAAGRLAVGDRLRLGPFAIETETNSGDEGPHTLRSTSYSNDYGRRSLPRALSGLLSRSLQHEQQNPPNTSVDIGSIFLDVHIVSLRSLRLSVRSMEAGETGTVGVQPIAEPSSVSLSRARKGMVLTSVPSDGLYGYRSFSAIFPASDFTTMTSPTLILGGHAIVYISSIRAAVKVGALILDESSSEIGTEPSSPAELFSFDGDEQDEREARITFRFVSSMEWIEVGNRVLVVPTVTAAGPITGAPVVFNGLSGFVGRVCDVFI